MITEIKFLQVSSLVAGTFMADTDMSLQKNHQIIHHRVTLTFCVTTKKKRNTKMQKKASRSDWLLVAMAIEY